MTSSYNDELRKTNIKLAAENEDLRRRLGKCEEMNWQRLQDNIELSKYCKELERLICES